MDSYKLYDFNELIDDIANNLEAKAVRKWLEKNFYHTNLACPDYENVACIGCDHLKKGKCDIHGVC